MPINVIAPCSSPPLLNQSTTPGNTAVAGIARHLIRVGPGERILHKDELQFIDNPPSPIDAKGTAGDRTASFFEDHHAVLGPRVIDRSIGMTPGREKGMAIKEYKEARSEAVTGYKKGAFTSFDHIIPQSVLASRPEERTVGKNEDREGQLKRKQLEMIAGKIRTLGYGFHANCIRHGGHPSTRVVDPKKGIPINAGERMTAVQRERHEKQREEYDENMRRLLEAGKVGDAISLQQQGYRELHGIGVANEEESRFHKQADLVALISFLRSVRNMDRIFFAGRDFWTKPGNLVEVFSVKVDAVTKLKAAIAQLDVTFGQTTLADVKEIILMEKFDVPDELKFLKEDITVADEQTKFEWPSPGLTRKPA